MTGMNQSLKMLMRCVRTGRMVAIIPVLALKVLGEHRMDRAAMNMTRISMAMICLGMHVEEWNHEHPERYPQEDQLAKIREFVTYPCHWH